MFIDFRLVIVEKDSLHMYYWKTPEELLTLFWLCSDNFEVQPKTQSYPSHPLNTPVTSFDYYLVQLILLPQQEKGFLCQLE